MFEFLTSIQDWIQQHEGFMWWFGIGSVSLFIISILSMPWLASQIPQDYFLSESRNQIKYQHWALYIVAVVLKNTLGLVLLLIGIIMIFLPGPGLLTIVIGIILLNFPGKFKLEQWLISRTGILKAINWLRAKRGKLPLLVAK